MRKIVIFLMLVLALTAACRAELFTTNVFSDYVLEANSYNISGNPMSVVFAGEKIAVTIGNERESIVNDTCSDTSSYVICFKGYYFDHYNYTIASRIVNKAKITVDKKVTRLNFSRDSQKDMLIGQQYTIKTTIQNSGDIDSEQVRYWDYLPKELDVFLSSDCSLSQNNLTWNGRLQPGEKKNMQRNS